MITKLADFSGICKFGSAKSCLSHVFFPLFGQFELSSTLQSVKMARQWGMDLRDYVSGTGSLQRLLTVLRRSLVRTRTSTTPVWMGSVRVGALVLRRSFVRTRTSTTPVWMGSVRVGALVLQRLETIAPTHGLRNRPDMRCNGVVGGEKSVFTRTPSRYVGQKSPVFMRTDFGTYQERGCFNGRKPSLLRGGCNGHLYRREISKK